jgi:hypothetical protein
MQRNKIIKIFLIYSSAQGVSENESKTKKKHEPSLIFCLIKVFGGKFFAGTVLKLVQDLIGFSAPILLE